jgi:hypothetical protein
MVRPPAPRPASSGALDPLALAIDTAIGGDESSLFASLTRNSGLPGVRVNAGVVQAFASLTSTRGARADALVRGMLHLHPDRAPGGTPFEILPVCAVAALGARGASDPAAVPEILPELESAAEDLRFRVRDEVPAALARIGEVRGEPLVVEVKGWMDGFFQAAAVLRAAAERTWLSRIHDPGPIVERMNEAFELARGADRADERYPGYKSLVVALETTPGVFAARFGAPVFDALVGWCSVKEPMLREAILASIGGNRIGKRFATDVARIHKALADSAPRRRDPRTEVGPTRGRGQKRKR